MPQVSILIQLTVIHPPQQLGSPAPDACQEKFNSRLVVPTFY
ncbi:MAG: hypothetical protein ABSB42_07510 [Tepidisphaeraceae bacterium]